jgi:hypothetical protein
VPLDEASCPPTLLAGLSDDERRITAREYFASFRWEPPAIDPAWLTASRFLALLDELDEPDGTRAR